MNRHYIRCTDCLSFGAVDGDYQPGWHCSLCAGPIELMGKVVEDTRKYETSEERSACDKRCTHAVGPICVCKCNCANHGTGRVVVVQIIKDLPTVLFNSDEQAAEAGRSYRQDIHDLRQLLAGFRAMAQDYSLPYVQRREVGQKCYYGDRAMQRAVEARTWKARTRHFNHALAITNGSVEPWSKPA